MGGIYTEWNSILREVSDADDDVAHLWGNQFLKERAKFTKRLKNFEGRIILQKIIRWEQIKWAA